MGLEGDDEVSCGVKEREREAEAQSCIQSMGVVEYTPASPPTTKMASQGS